MNDITTQDDGPQPATQIYRPSAAIDPARLDYLWGLSEKMAYSSAVPKSLTTAKVGGNEVELAPENIAANLFLVFEQADRWNMSPFALMGCAAIVHGKLGFEGKVISAVLKSCYGIDLEYSWSGAVGTDERKITVKGTKIGSSEALIIEGTVAHWKTIGNNSPWKPQDYDKMLAYRGAREWARLHEPSAILGVLSDDELVAIDMERRAQNAREIGSSSLQEKFGGNTASQGFNNGNAARQIADARQAPMDTDKREAEKVSGKGPGVKEKTEGAATVHDETERMKPAVFTDFSGALARVNTTESLEKARAKFWEDNGLEPTHRKDVALAKQIFGAHETRINGKVTLADINEQLPGVIEKSFEVKV